MEENEATSEEELEYAAPDIEEVISLEDLDQESLYAGAPVGSAAPL